MKTTRLALLMAVLTVVSLQTNFTTPHNSGSGQEGVQNLVSQSPPIFSQAPPNPPGICQLAATNHLGFNPREGENPDASGHQNNKFGLYIYAADPTQVTKAAALINSQGGDWGYVTVPIDLQDLNWEVWRNLFATLNQQHLIPIVQLFNLQPEEVDHQTLRVALFLNTLPWPIRPRYISVYNEVNDGKFWWGQADPGQYARTLALSVKLFKAVNPDFFMMNGAFNSSARSGGGYIDEEVFLLQMNRAVPEIFSQLDGWASHPYPQPNFAGTCQARGRDSIRAYEWELQLLQGYFGVSGLPVFITETGWAHAEGTNYNESYLTADQAAANIKIAYEQVWLPDDRVVAVTPFTIYFPPPFDHFSWVDDQGHPYAQYQTVQEIGKVAGLPPFRLTETKLYFDCYQASN